MSLGYDDFARETAAERQRTLGAQFAEGEGTGNWVGFAALILSLAGLWNALDGILAITHSRVYPAITTFAFGDLRTWGWIALVLGIVQVAAAFGLMSGRSWARWFAIACACVYAQTIAREDAERRQSAFELADLFAKQARRRAEALFRELWSNDDASQYRAAQQVLDGRYAWFDEDVMDPSGEGPMLPAPPAPAKDRLAGANERVKATAEAVQ